MLDLVSGNDVLAKFHELMKRTNRADLGVAFWGDSAAKALKIRKGQRIRIVCNLESGACNPDEIRRLRSLVSVKTHTQLHAKVYITDRGVIVGSSNVSTNGLAMPGRAAAGWHEANIVTDNQNVVSQAKKWFEKIWNDARQIKEGDLKNAKQLWKKRVWLAPTAKGRRLSLLRVSQENPSLLKSMYCLVWCEKLDRGARKRAKEIKAQRVAAPEELVLYQPATPFEPGSWLISCQFTSDRPTVNGYLQVPDPALVWNSTIESETKLCGAFWRPRGIEVGGHRYTLSSAEKAKLSTRLRARRGLERIWHRGDALIPLQEILDR